MKRMKANAIVNKINSFNSSDDLMDFYFFDYLPSFGVSNNFHYLVRRAFVRRLVSLRVNNK